MKRTGLQVCRLTLGNARSSGTFAEVYEGILEFNQQRKTTAVKILKKKWLEYEDLMNRLEDEARLLDQLNHPNIIQVYGMANIDGRPSVIMELINGIDLRDLLLKHPLPANIAFLIAAKVARALDAAYRQKLTGEDQPLKVIHRDIKPSNVMLTQDGQVKVLDFGASKFQDPERKGKTTVYQFGSPKYMPPERKQGERGEHGSDIYSLGIMLIEMLRGKVLSEVPPSEKPQHDRYISAHIETIDFQLPNREWSNRAKEMLMRMCAFNQEDRLSARKWLQLLDAFATQAKGPNQEQFLRDYLTPILTKHNQKLTSQGPLTKQRFTITLGLNQEPHEEPSASEPTITSPPVIRPSIFNKSFYMAACISGLLSFFLLTSVTVAFSHFTGRIDLFAKEQTTDTKTETNTTTDTKTKTTTSTATETKTDAFTITISLDPNYVRKVKLINQAKKTVLEVKRSKKQNQDTLPSGNYYVEALFIGQAKWRKSKPFALQQDMDITCKLVNASKERCIDQNGKTLIR